MDPLKEAFAKIKQDISLLQEELSLVRQEIKLMSESRPKTSKQEDPTQAHMIPHNQPQQTNRQHTPTDNPTQNMSLEPLKSQNGTFSTGNRGVPTDKQTNNQTVQQTQNVEFSAIKSNIGHNSGSNTFDEANEAINALNTLKNEIKHKFKSLTPQEMLVFSTIYEFQDQSVEITYKTIAKHLSLSESSIRDYTNRLIKKDVPILKEKVNNKLILLSISPNLRKNLSLSSIISLRSL